MQLTLCAELAKWSHELCKTESVLLADCFGTFRTSYCHLEGKCTLDEGLNRLSWLSHCSFLVGICEMFGSALYSSWFSGTNMLQNPKAFQKALNNAGCSCHKILQYKCKQPASSVCRECQSLDGGVQLISPPFLLSRFCAVVPRSQNTTPHTTAHDPVTVMAINVRARSTSETRSGHFVIAWRCHTCHVFHKADSLFVEQFCVTLALQREFLYTYLIEDWWWQRLRFFGRQKSLEIRHLGSLS